jgi:hypothetical protein
MVVDFIWNGKKGCEPLEAIEGCKFSFSLDLWCLYQSWGSLVGFSSSLPQFFSAFIVLLPTFLCSIEVSRFILLPVYWRTNQCWTISFSVVMLVSCSCNDLILHDNWKSRLCHDQLSSSSWPTHQHPVVILTWMGVQVQHEQLLILIRIKISSLQAKVVTCLCLTLLLRYLHVHISFQNI